MNGHRQVLAAGSAVLSRLVVRAVTLVLLVVIARVESTQYFAAYSYLLVLSVSFGSLADLGAAAIAGREVARGAVSVEDAYRAGMPVQLLSSTVAAGGLVAVGLLVPGPVEGVAPVLAAAALTFATDLFDYVSELLRATARPVAEGVLQVVGAVLHVALGCAVVLLGGSLALLLAVLAGRTVVLYALAHWWLPAPWRGRRDRARSRSFLRQGALLGVAGAASALLWRLPQILLGATAAVATVADYGLASRFQELARSVCQSAGFGVLPGLAARDAQDDRTASRRAARRLLRLSFWGSAAATVPVLVLLPYVIPAVFGESFRSAVLPSVALLAAVPLITVLYLSWFVLLSRREERYVLQASLVGLLVVALGTPLLVLDTTALQAALVSDAALLATTGVLWWRVARPGAARPAPAA